MKNWKTILIILSILAFIPAASAASQYDVVIARGDILTDSLVAQVYTQEANVPLITVSGSGLTRQTRNELKIYSSQGKKKALIIGGEEAVQPHVKRELTELNYSVERLWDWTRYGTAGRVAINLWGETDSVVVAADYEGNLIAASQTAMEDSIPLLITETEKLNKETRKAIVELRASRIILVGEVSETVQADLAELGTIEQTSFTLLRPEEPGYSGIFLIGIIVGGLVIFLFSTLWKAGFLKKATGVPYEILEKDEREIIDILLEGDKPKQNEVAEETGFSKSKVSRITSELEERNIIEKKREGKSQILILKKEILKG